MSNIEKLKNTMMTEKHPEQLRQEMKDLIKAKYNNLTEVEMLHLFHLAKDYGLDPNKREIWAVKYGNKPAAMFVGRDGLLAIAHKTGEFDGMDTQALVVTKSGDIQAVDITYPGAKLVGAKCTIYRKDMSHAVSVSVRLDEYNTNKNNWQKMPETMIKKVAEAHALRRAFSIHGVYTPEEMDQVGNGKAMNDGDYTVESAKKEEPAPQLVKDLPEETQSKIKGSIIGKLNELSELTGDSVQILHEEELDDNPVDDMYYAEAKEAYKKLNEKVKNIQALDE